MIHLLIAVLVTVMSVPPAQAADKPAPRKNAPIIMFDTEGPRTTRSSKSSLEKKKPKSLYFPEDMSKRKKAHPDFLWHPK